MITFVLRLAVTENKSCIFRGNILVQCSLQRNVEYLYAAAYAENRLDAVPEQLIQQIHFHGVAQFIDGTA